MIFFLLLTLLFIVSYLGFWQGRGTENYYTSKPIYISHRGVTKNNPENTIEAFKEADTGLVVLDGKLIEKPVLRHMERVLAISTKLSQNNT